MLSYKSITKIAVYALLAILSAGTAFAESGQSSKGTAKVTANIPEFIVLHYYSTLTLNFETPTSEALGEGESVFSVSWEGKAEGEGLSTTSLMDAALELDGTKTTVNLSNVWAVRGFSKDGTASVSVVVPSGGDVLKNGASTIGMSNVKVTHGSSTDDEIEINLGGIAKGSATIGGIVMDLDFSNTNRSGSHTGGQYTITASTI